MTALSDALAAAQARAIAAIGKDYVCGRYEGDDADVFALMDTIGCMDKVEQAQLVSAWNIMRVNGAQPVGEQKPAQNGPDRSRATDAQLSLMRKIAGERNYTLPDDPQLLSRDDASKVIDSMKAGEYDQATWAVPF